MLGKVARQIRYRAALRGLVDPAEADPAYFSRFGGLWTDRRDALEELDRRVGSGKVTGGAAELLRHWIEHGWVTLEGAVAPEVCDELREDLDAAFASGDQRLLIHSPAGSDYQPLTAGLDTDRARVVDVYVHYASARRALFSPPIVSFLANIFDAVPLLFQSLTFERGSQQQMHQDTAFVVVSSPLEFAASWIALEDIQPGSGELMYLDRSHHLPEYLFSGKYKHWNAKRDGDEQHAQWHASLYENARGMGLEERTFLPRKGDVLMWSADLAHGGSPVSDPSLTRKSLVGHYCPNRVDPFYFKVDPKARAKGSFDGCRYSSSHYRISEEL
ncbi:MAG: phytanoyl-CoA dioxygenase family protein [Solirubrobacterales bacterium]|nr:phytanoyl-CoA dioxygenase family protein [Solirubrobacterales bacterium]